MALSILHKKNRPLAVAGVVLFVILIGIVAAVSYSALVRQVNAASTKSFNPGTIISQANFTNNKSMSASEIQAFLKKKNSTCLQNYKGLALIDANKNGQIEDWTAAEQYGGPTKKQEMTAAQLIKAAADTYGINPQVLLVTLEKEQGLVTRSDCPEWRYNTAFGFGCPDTAPCDTAAYGFTRQLDNAAYHFKNYMTGEDVFGNIVYSTYKTGSQPVSYHPGPCQTYNSKGECTKYKGRFGNIPDNAYCGRPSLNITNLATASLYTYTPYQPNQASLDAGYSASSNECAAYGNRNFHLFYNDWFGSTKFRITGSIEKYYDTNNGLYTLGEPLGDQKTDNKGTWWQRFEKGYIAGSYSSGYYAIKGSIGKQFHSIGGIQIIGKPLESEQKDGNGDWWQRFEKGYIAGSYSSGYYAIKGSIGKQFIENNGKNDLGKPLSSETRRNGSIWSQQFKNGYIVGKYGTGYWKSKGSIRKYWLSSGSENGRLGLPTSNETKYGDGWYQTYQNGLIAGKYSYGYYDLKGSIGNMYTKNIKYSISKYGYPISAESKEEAGHWSQEFEKTWIVGSNGRYYTSTGPIRDKWLEMGGWTGKMGALSGNIAEYPDGGLKQLYSNGWIVKSPRSNSAWESKGTIRKVWISLGEEKSKLGYPVSSEKLNSTSNIWSQKYENGTIETKDGKLYKVTYTD